MNRIDDRGIIVTDSSEAIGLVRSTVADPNTLAPLTP